MIETRADAIAAALEFLRGRMHAPVIIEAVELDTWWRIFYTWDRHDGALPGKMSPTVVPLAVDKASGEVQVEWPLRPYTPTAQECLKAFLTDHVAPALRALGFRGSQQSFTQPSDTHFITVRVIRSSNSNAAIVECAANVQIIARDVWRQEAQKRRIGDKPDPRAIYGGGIGVEDPLGRWYVYAGASLDELASTAIPTTRDRIIDARRKAGLG